MLMNFILIVVTWSAPQCALEAREEEKEGALQRTPAPARGPDHGAQSCVCSLEWGGAAVFGSCCSASVADLENQFQLHRVCCPELH